MGKFIPISKAKTPVDRDNDGKVGDGTPQERSISPEAKAAIAGGVLGATVLSRGQANRLGRYTALRTSRRGDWAADRADKMRNQSWAGLRRRYARGLNNQGARMARSDDTREIAGRATAAAATAAVTGTISSLNRKSKEEK